MVTNHTQFIISLYGPPGSGKSSVGRLLAARLRLPFWDLDEEIQARSKRTISEIFDREGEAGFRRRERRILRQLLANGEGVLALGGGALLDPSNRKLVESCGPVLCLISTIEKLMERMGADASTRPLLAGDLRGRLESLMAQRLEHYSSFPEQLDADQHVERVAREAQVRVGAFHVEGMGQGYDVRVKPGVLDVIGDMLASRGLMGPVAVVSDQNVGLIYAQRLLESLQSKGFSAHEVFIPAGEQHKNMQTVAWLWEQFLEKKIERSSTVLALGGGVVGDATGFASATYLRGVSWVALPTSLLAMVDASVGGKTGVDLPQGKNLVGAFYPPRLVLADPQTLDTLPEAELRSGMAEVVKAGVIGDPVLFDLCTRGWDALRPKLGEVVRRAMAVKIAVIEADPYESGRRAVLNLGHTIGHAVELVSNFQLRHGEAVSIGMVAASRLAVRLEIAGPGLADKIERVLKGLGLPVEIPAELDRQAVLSAMQLDKKRLDGSVRFVLPVRLGDVRVGVDVNLHQPSLFW
jgi:3-dehydroquinate synthase